MLVLPLPGVTASQGWRGEILASPLSLFYSDRTTYCVVDIVLCYAGCGVHIQCGSVVLVILSVVDPI